MRPTGIDIIGDVPWGTHFCQFYQDERDLADVLVPYFRSGLEANDFCMWIASEPLRADAARRAMAAAVPDLDERERRGQIEFLDYSQWYTLGGTFDADRVLRGWVDKLDAARARGFEGLRLSGNTFWLEQSAWNDFTQYEAAVNAVIPNHHILALCTYSLARCGAAEILDVMSNHAFALIRRADRWQVIESAQLKRVEASLRLTEERYGALFDAMSEGFALHEIVCDESGEPCDYRFLDMNPAFERLTGLAREDVVGRLLSEVLPHDDPKWVKTYGRVALTGEAVHFENYSPALGRHYEVFAYRTAPGQFATVFRDVTDHRRAEQELVEANRLKDEFLATLSHELRTPLHAIIGWSDLLLKGNVDAGTSRRALESIARNALAQAQLVADVLDVSRIIAGKLRLNVRAADVGSLLQNAVDVVRPAAEAKGILLELTVAAGPLVVTGDPDRLQQVFWNLLSNAVKFTPSGGHVQARVERSGTEVTVRVGDTGTGIEPEFLSRVFERFLQADSSASRPQGGLGLGLAIVRHLVELHGGTVGAESGGKGRGATFTVRLPVRAVLDRPEGSQRPSGAVASSEERAHPRNDVLCGRSVLVVDDEADARELVEAVLTRHGAEVRTAGSVSEALGVLGAWTPDIVLADIGMPGEDGYRLIERVRALPDPRVAGIPAIALTAYGRADDRQRALGAGYQHHIAKPVLPDELVAVVMLAAAPPTVESSTAARPGSLRR